MDPRSALLIKKAPFLAEETLLLAGLPADNLLQHFTQAEGWSWYADQWSILHKRFPERCHFGTEPKAKHYTAAILFLPKSRRLTEYLLQALAAQVPDGRLFVVGENRAGISSIGKQLAAYGTARKLESALHCQLWQVPIQESYAVPLLEDWFVNFAIDTPDTKLRVMSLPGVFSHGRLDIGTGLLLKHLANLPNGHLLDFGCGAGILGAALKKRYPESKVSLLDIDAFALASSRKTLTMNQLEADVIAAEDANSIPHGITALLSNPPFHQGIHTQHQVAEQLIRTAPLYLTPQGSIRLVANSFLAYPALLAQYFGAYQVLEKYQGFHIYSAQRP